MPADAIVPFAFDALPVRGAVIQLSASWQRMQRDHSYNRLLAETLGHAAAATGLIAQSLKFDGAITLQLQGGAALSMLVVQCSSDLDIRGMAKSDAGKGADSFAALTRGAHCAITLDSGDRPYQGVVAIDGESLSASLEHYFDRSVQVPSHVALVASERVAGGVLLQQMPGEAMPADDWNRLGFLVRTLTSQDIERETGLSLIAKLFSEDDVRVRGERPVRFKCRCSNQKVEDVLKMLGEAEARAALDDQGEIEVVCEYCGEKRCFDSVDVGRLFSDNVVSGPESVQ